VTSGMIARPKAKAISGDAAVASAFEIGSELPNKHGSRNISVLKLTIEKMEKRACT
jgi:hypothetical protein